MLHINQGLFFKALMRPLSAVSDRGGCIYYAKILADLEMDEVLLPGSTRTFLPSMKHSILGGGPPDWALALVTPNAPLGLAAAAEEAAGKPRLSCLNIFSVFRSSQPTKTGLL